MQKLFSLDTAGKDVFCCSVTLDGDTVLVGVKYDHDNGYDSGAVYVLTRTGTTWSQQAKLLASDDEEQDNFGSSASLSGDTALI